MDFTAFNNPAVLVTIIPGVLIALNLLLVKMGMNTKFAPLVNIIGGMVAVFPFMEMGLKVIPAIIGGLIIGLSAGGFYDFGKEVKKAIE